MFTPEYTQQFLEELNEFTSQHRPTFVRVDTEVWRNYRREPMVRDRKITIEGRSPVIEKIYQDALNLGYQDLEIDRPYVKTLSTMEDGICYTLEMRFTEEIPHVPSENECVGPYSNLTFEVSEEGVYSVTPR